MESGNNDQDGVPKFHITSIDFTIKSINFRMANTHCTPNLKLPAKSGESILSQLSLTHKTRSLYQEFIKACCHPPTDFNISQSTRQNDILESKPIPKTGLPTVMTAHPWID